MPRIVARRVEAAIKKRSEAAGDPSRPSSASALQSPRGSAATKDWVHELKYDGYRIHAASIAVRWRC
jgi:ATP-dependent DNA ligase